MRWEWNHYPRRIKCYLFLSGVWWLSLPHKQNNLTITFIISFVSLEIESKYALSKNSWSNSQPLNTKLKLFNYSKKLKPMPNAKANKVISKITSVSKFLIEFIFFSNNHLVFFLHGRRHGQSISHKLWCHWWEASNPNKPRPQHSSRFSLDCHKLQKICHPITHRQGRDATCNSTRSLAKIFMIHWLST